MRFWYTFLFAIFLLRPSVSLAQQASGLVDRISSLRLSIERIQDAESAVRTHRDALAKQHEALARQIKDIKESMGKSVLPNFPLEAKLRKSQDLSESLTLLNRELDALNRARKKSLRQLSEVYDRLVEQTAQSARGVSGHKKQNLLRLLGRARTERKAVRVQLSDSLALPGAIDKVDESELLASDDPEELSERADAVRDEQDKLRKELAFVDGRLKQLVDEARLDREMRDFVGDQDIFNEGSRVLVVPSASAQKNEGDTDNTYDNGSDLVGGQDGDDREGAPSSLSEPGAGGPEARLVDGAEDSGSLLSGGPKDSSSTSEKLIRRKAWIVKRLKRLQNVHDRILEHMEEIEKE